MPVGAITGGRTPQLLQPTRHPPIRPVTEQLGLDQVHISAAARLEAELRERAGVVSAQIEAKVERSAQTIGKRAEVTKVDVSRAIRMYLVNQD